MARKVLIAAIVIAAVLVAFSLLLRRLVDPETIRTAVERQATAALGQPVKVGAVDWSLSMRPRVVLTNVQIGAPAAITFHRVELTSGLRALLSKRVEQGGVTVSGSQVVLPLPIAFGGDVQKAEAAPVAASAGFFIASIDRISLGDIDLVVGNKHLRLDAECFLSGDRLVVSQFALRSDQTAVHGEGEFSSLSGRRAVFAANANPLDLDELLAIASGFGSSTTNSRTDAARGPSVPLDVRLNLAGSRGRLLGVEFTNLVTTLAIAGQGVTLEPLKLDVFNGTLEGRMRLDASSNRPNATLNARLAGLDVAQLAAIAGASGVITGRVHGDVNLRAEATTTEGIIRTAAGRATLSIRDGTMPGLDLVGPAIRAFGKSDTERPSNRSAAFSRLSGTFVLGDGVLRSEDLSMLSRDVDLNGHGTVTVRGADVDVRADLVLSEELSSQAGRDLYRYAHEGSRIVLPATITGTLASPSVSIDLAAALERAGRNALEERIKKALRDWIKKPPSN